MKKLYASIVAISLLTSIGYGMDEKEKSGFFAGVDLSGASYYYTQPNKNPFVSSPFPTETDYSFNYGIKGGYQFYATPKHGLRVGLHLNLGSYNSEFEGVVTSTSGSSGGSTGGGGTIANLESKFYGIRYGLDVDYLYDFYNSTNNSAGISLGFGYELANFVGGEIKYATTSSGTTNSLTLKNSLFGSGTYLNLGAHYYLKNSQFEIGLRIPFNVLSGAGDYTASGTTKNENIKTSDGTTTIPLMYQYGILVPYSSIHFSYSYRF